MRISRRHAIGAACASLVFLGLTAAVLKGVGESFELRLLTLIKGWTSPTLDNITASLTQLGSATVLTMTTVLATAFLFILPDARRASKFLFTVTGAEVLHVAGKTLMGRERPTAVIELVQLHTASFPSGHALMVPVIYVTLALLAYPSIKRTAARRFLLASTIALAAAIGLTRLYMGVHYPSDILAGWCLAAAWMGVSFTMFGWLWPAKIEAPLQEDD